MEKTRFKIFDWVDEDSIGHILDSFLMYAKGNLKKKPGTAEGRYQDQIS